MFSASKTAAPSGYNIQRSVRLRSSASAYFNRTFTTPTSATVWTWSAWVKRGALTGTYRLFGASTTTYLTFNSSDQLNLTLNGVSAATSTAVFRDPSAWYHIVYQQNGSAQTIYVNNVSVATGTTAASIFNTAIAHQIGAANTTNYFDGYLTEVNFIDGQALTPTSFGAYNSTTGVWQPIRYAGTYGTNGFYLNFKDNTSTTTLGYDYSGNSNNWTANNISLTAGTTYDSMTDVPTLTSPTQANFAVINPINQSGQTITNGNMTTQWSLTAAGNRSTFAMDSGQWYWEVTMTSIGTQTSTGIVRTDTSLTADFAVVGSNAVSYLALNGNKILNGTASAYGATFTTGDVIGVAVDITNNTATFYKNGTSQGQITGLSLSGFSWYAATANANNQASQIANYNFGQRPFSYTPPTGFNRLNTYNLPTPSVKNGAAQFAATTYTGTGATLTVANTVNTVNFQPDFVWVKGRSGATDHALYDSVRGTTKQIESNTTTAETTESTGLTTFGSTGFTVGALAQMNTNTATYIGWQWKASNATAVSNTSGSITSQVSVNATAGFSIVTYTGTGANATVGHGLGVAPSMVIVKRRDTTGAFPVRHTSITAANTVYLNTTAASASATTVWNSTAPTSTVFSIGTSTDVNANTGTYVAYCFAAISGYSAFGSYTGNGAADGPFVYTGFRPRYVCVKRSDGVGGWTILDSSRDTYNVAGNYLFSETSAAEGSTPLEDFLSNGFKLRATSSSVNSVGTYIYFAFAENPFNYSLAR
jgi:hypothetical protein